MRTLEDMEKMIYEIRQRLHIIIEKKNNLLDTEVIAESQKLDLVLNEYNKKLKLNL